MNFRSFLFKFILLLLGFAHFHGISYAQPNWFPGTPSIDPFAVNLEVHIGLDQSGTVYGTLVRFDYDPGWSATDVKNYAQTAVNSGRISNLVHSITAGEVNSSITEIIEDQFSGGYLVPNTIHTLFIVAEDDATSTLTGVTRIVFSTSSCPSIFVETGLNNTDRCVNGDGATKYYTLNTKDEDFFPGSDAGILAGAEWYVDWGEGGGSTLFHTSMYNNDGPGNELVPGWEYGQIQNTYNSHDSCYNIVNLLIVNPGTCSSTGAQSESKIPTLHGRDLDLDGNGEFIVDEVGTGVIDTIYVCEGYEYTTSIEDISTWDCQPDIYLPGDSPGNPSGEVNDANRSLQWVYGGSAPDGSLEAPANTITGDVVIGGLGVATNGGPGVIGDTVVTNNPIFNESAPITIPATAQEGEMFKIYYKNWNYCNSFSGTEFNNSNYIEDEIVILIIHAPDPPIAPDAVYCESAIGNLTAATTEGGALTWYSDAALTIVVGTGGTLNHGQTTPGAYTYYVTESLVPCEGAPEEVVLTITPEITNNLINDNGESFCASGDPSLIDGDTPGGGDGDLSDDMQWQISTNGGSTWTDIAGAISEDYDPVAIITTTMYRRNISSGNCTSTSNEITIVVYDLASATDPQNRIICEDSRVETGNTSFSVTVSGAARTMQWQRSGDGGTSWVDITNTTVPADGCNYSGWNTNALSIVSADFGQNGFQYRLKMTTTVGGCETFSNPGTLTVNPVPDIDTNPSNTTICEFDNTTFSVVASIPAGSITTYQWQQENSNLSGGYNPEGVYSSWNNPTLVVTGPSRALNNDRHRVFITSDLGCRERTNNFRLYVNPQADITVQPQPSEVCVSENTSFTVATDGNPVVTGYQWQVSTNGGSTWNNVAGGVYSGQTTATLSLTNTPIGGNGNLYKCILTTNGPCPIDSNTALLTVNPNPTASITPAAPSELCNGDVLSFNGQPAGGTGGYVHSWTGDTGPLNATNTVNPDFTAPILGGQNTYNLTYTVTDSKTCSATDNVAVVVNPAVTVNLTASLAEVCSGGTVNLDGDPQGGTGAIGSVWTGTGAVFLTGAGTPTPVFNAPAVFVQSTYTFTYTATDSKGCDAQQTITIDVNPNPSASILPGIPAELCFADVLSLNGNPSGGTGGYIHAWTGDVTPLDVTNAVNPDFTGPSTVVQTSYNLTYTVQDGKGCFGTDAVTLVVNPEVVSAVLSGDASLCSGNFADLQVVINGGTGNYTVTLGDLDPPLVTVVNNYVSGANINTGPHSIASNTYTITSVVDSKGCQATSETGSAVIVVGSVPTSAVLAGQTAICFGASTPLQVNITGGAPPYTVDFDALPDEVNYTSGDDIATGILGLGTFDFNIVSVTDNCGVSISGAAVAGGNPQQITVNSIPVITPVNNLGVICSDGTTDIDLATSVAGTVYTWTVDDGGGITWVGGKAPTGNTITNGVGVQTIAQNLQHSMTTTVSVDYILTSAGPLPTTCPGNSLTETVIVEPVPEAAITNSTQTICDGAVLAGMVVSSVVTHNGLPTFDLSIVATTGAMGDLTATGVALTPVVGQAYPYTISGTLTNNTDDAIIIEYRVTPLLAGCSSGSVETAVVTIEPTPVAAISNNVQTICDGAALTDLVVTNEATHSGIPLFDMVIVATTGALGDLVASGNALTPRTGRAYPYTINGTLTNNTNDAIVIEYRVTPLLAACGSGSVVVAVVTIEPTPIAAISNSVQTLCDGDGLSGMVVSSLANPTGAESFDLTIVATTGNLAGLTATGLALSPVAGEAYPYTISGTLTNNTNDVIVVEYRVIPLLAGCGSGSVVTAVVTIEPTPLAAISNDVQTICDGASITDMDITNEATHSGTPAFTLVITALTGNLGDLTGTGNVLTTVVGQAYPYSISGTLTNNTDDAIVIEYSVLPTLPGCSDGSDVLATITIEPTPVAVISNALQTLCDGGALVGMEVSSAANPLGAESFNLDIVATTGNVAGLSGTANSLTTGLGLAYPYTISGTLTNNTDDVIVIEYRVTPLLAGCGAGSEVVAVVTIEPTPVAAISNILQTICNGGALTGMVVSNEASHSGVPLFDLTIVATTGDLTDLVATGVALTTVSGQGYSYTIGGTLTNTTSDAIVIEYRVTPLLAGCGDGTVVVAVVTIEPAPAATISNNAQVLCDGAALTGMVVATASNPSGVENFNLDIIATVGNLGGLTGTGGALTTVTSGSYPYAINGNLTNNTDDAITVQYRVTPLLAGCVNGSVVTATVVIEPRPVAAISNNVQTICDGALLTSMIVSNEATHNGVPLFDLTIAATTGNLGDLVSTGLALMPVSGQAYPYSISGTLTNNTDDAIVIEYRVTPLLAACGPGTDVLATVTIEPSPRAAISNALQTLCDGGSLVGMAVTSAANPTGAEAFDLSIVATTGNLANLTATGLALTTVSSQAYPYTISGGLTNSTNDAIVIEYRVTPLLAGCGSGTVVTAVVTIEPTPVAVISNSLQTICDGASLTGMVVSDLATHSGAPAFDLSIVATTGNIGNLTATGNALTTRSDQSYPYTIGGTLTNNTNAAITIEYRVIPKLAGCGPGSLVTAIVTIEPTPVAAISNNLQTLCDGATLSDMLVSNLATHAGAASFDLDIVATSGNLADLTATGNALTTVPGGGYPYTINGTLTNNSNVTIVIEYIVTPLLAGCSKGVDAVSVVTIYPKPNVIATDNNPVFPTGDDTDILLNGDVAGTVFGWRVLNPGATGATDGGGLIDGESIVQTLFNVGSVPVSVTYRIGPEANGCLGDSIDVIVSVEPSVDVIIVNNAPNLCPGGLTDIDLSSSAVGVTFLWVVTDPDGTGATAGSGGPDTHTIQQPLVNATSAPISVTYTVTPVGPPPLNLVGISKDAVVTVYPKPLGLFTNLASPICDGSLTNILLDSDAAGTTFTWTVTDASGLSGALPSGGFYAMGDSISQILSNSSNLPITVTYHILPTGQNPTNCVGDIVDVDVIVDPTPLATPNNILPVICSDEFTDITLNASVAGTSFIYTVADPKGTGASDGVGVIGTVISQSLVNTTQTPVTITYEIVPIGPGGTACPGASVFENVTVNPLPITSPVTGIDTVCEGTADLVFSVVHTADSYYEWNVPGSLGSPTFGGSGMDSYAVIILAANTPIELTDSIWVFETNKYTCTKDTIYHPLTLVPFPLQTNILGDNSVCAQTTHTYSVPIHPGSSYQWFIPPGSGFASADPTLNTVDITFGLISGQVRVIETSSGGCVTIHIPLNISVNQLPISTLNADQIAACDGDTITFTAGPAGALNYEFFVNGGSEQTGVSNVFKSGDIVDGDEVTVNVTSLDGCEKLSAPLPITIYAPPVVVLTSSDADNIICAGENVDFTATSASAVSYNFFLNGSSEQNGPLNFWSSIGLLSGDRLSVEVISAFGCLGISDTITTLVNDLPVAELTGDAVICPGMSTDLFVEISTGASNFEVTIDNGVGLISNYVSSTAIPVSPAFTTTYTLVSVSDANSCISAILTPSAVNLSGSAVVTIRDTVEILTQPNDALVCEGVDTSFSVIASGDGLLYQWEVTDDLVNPFVAIGGATSASYAVIAPSAAIDGNYYRVRVSSSFCPEFAYSDTAQLVLLYDPALVSGPSDQIICEADGTGFAVDAGLTSNPVFVWEVSYDGGSVWLTLGDTAVYNGTSTDSMVVISASSRFNGYQYRAVVTGGCGTPVISNAALLSVDERPEILRHPSDTTVCENQPLSFEVDAGVTSAATYQWLVDMGSGFVILGDTVGVYGGTGTAELNVLNPVSRFNGYAYQVLVNGTCTPTALSTKALLTVGEVPEIVLQPRDTVICENENALFFVNAGVTTNAVFQWKVSYNGGGAWLPLGDTAIYTGANSNILRLSGVPSIDDGNLYQVIVSGLCTPAVTSAFVSLTVKERPEILQQPVDSIVCEGTPASFEVDAGVTTAVLYQWQVNMGSGFVNLGDTAGIYSGATNAVLDVLLTESRFDGYRYRVLVTGDCTPMQVSNTATLVVQEVPEITLQPVPVTICEEQNTFFTTSSGSTTAPSYLWQVDMGSGFVDIGADTGVYSGTGTPSLFLTLVPSGFDGYSYHLVVSGVCTPEVTSANVVLTVNDLPEILLEPVNDTICEGDAAIYTIDAGVTTGVSYQWKVNRIGLWEDLSDNVNYAGTATPVLTVSSASSAFNGYRYRVEVSGSCTPPVISAQALLVINERPEIISQPVDKEVCEDGDAIFVVGPGATTAPVILWEYSVDGVGWAAASTLAEVSDDTNDTLLVSGIPSAYDGYLFHAVIGGECPVPVTSDQALMTVYQKPEILIQPADVLACEQDTVMFFMDAGLTTSPVYQWEIWNGAAWTIPPPDIYSGVNSDTMYISGIHSGIDQLQIRLRLSGICTPDQISDTAVLGVNERPEVVSQPENMIICANDSVSFGVGAGVTTVPVFTWEYFDGGLWQLATGGFFEDETTDTLRLYGATGVPSSWTGTLFRAIISSACGPNDTSDVVTLVVNVRPEIIIQPIDAISCEGIASSFSIDAGATAFPSYLWQFHDGTLWAPVTGLQYSGQGTNTLNIVNPTSNMNGYGYRVILSGACDPGMTSDSVSMTVLENPEIILQPGNAAICEDGDTTFIIDAGVTTNPLYKWFYNDGVSGWLELSADGIHSGFTTNTLVVSTALFTMDNWLYRVEVTGSCGVPAISQSAALVVYKLPEIIEQPGDTTTCEMMNVAFRVDVGATDAPFLQWEEFDGVAWSVLSDGGNYIGVNTTELKVYSVDSAMTGFRYRVRVLGVCDPEALSLEAELIVESAPEIWLQPVDANICEGENTSFSISATGTNISYFWQLDDGTGFADITDSDGGVYAGWDTNTLSVTAADRSYNFNKYRIRIEGACIPVAMSNLGILFVQTPAEIQVQAVSDIICEFENAIFSVTATGEALAYQWQESNDNGASWSDLSDVGLYIGSLSPTLTIFAVDRGSDGLMYRNIITGACGLPVSSDEIQLSVETSPEILRQPEALTACENMPAGFGVDAEGTNILYRWQLNDGGGFTDIADGDARFIGAGSDTLTLLSTQLGQAGFSFRVSVTGNCLPPAISNPVLLLVNANPTINTQPVDAALCEDGTTVFGADASGAELMYQWYVDRQDGSGFVVLNDDAVHIGTTTDQILLSNVPVSQDGWQYRLDVFNACTDVQTNAVTLTIWANPVPAISPAVPANFPNYPQICGGQILRLDGNPTSGSGSYTLHQWSGAVGPLSVIDEQLTDFMTIVKGDYDLVYMVSDSRGCKGSDVVTIINDRPNAQFVSNAIPSCGYMEVDFTNTSSADAVSYLWDFDDGETSTLKDVTHGFDNELISGQVAYYNISMVATSTNGCNDTALSVITIYPKVVAEIDADPIEGCHPLQVTLLSQPGGASYNWEFGDGKPAQDGSYLAYHLFENFGTTAEVYTVTLTTTSHYGCQDSKTVDITVQPIPQPNFTAAPLIQTYPDATVNFNNLTQTGPWTFLWSFGDSITSTEENPTHTYAVPGTFDVGFYVMNGECMDSSKITVVINPRIPIAAFAEPEGGCNPVEVEFVNQSQWANNYLWDFGDGYVSTKENPSHSYYDIGEYTIRLQATGPGGTDFTSWTIEIFETPNVGFNSSPDSVFVKDKPVRFYNLTAGATNYAWDFGDYDEDGKAAPSNFSNAFDTTHIYFTEGYKDVKLVAWNEHCSDSLTLPAVKVIPKGQLEFPTVFRPDLGGSNGGYVDPNDPSVDPNYANSIFFPGVNKQVQEYHLYIYNRWGEQIFQSHDINIGWDGYVKGALAGQGVYFWKVNVVYKNGSPDTDRGDITLLHKKQQ